MIRSGFLTLVFIFFILFSMSLRAQDNVNEKDEVKHYVKPTFYYSAYSSSERKLLVNKSETYKFTQNNIGGFVPIFTKTDEIKGDKPGNVIQFLATGNISIANPQFSFISSDHKLIRANLGISGIFNQGVKNVFFINALPFLGEDQNAIQKTPRIRLNYMFIYNRTVSEKFSYRIGFARTYLFNTSPMMPILGIRIGRYDRFHFNLQFPRYISFDWPLDEHFAISFFRKTVGGIYGLRNVDFKTAEYESILFRRQENLNGIEWSYNSRKALSFFFSAGLVGNNVIVMNQIESSRLRAFQLNYRNANLLGTRLEPALFVQLGLQIAIGKAKKIYQNVSMYDAINMNGSFSRGDVNENFMDAPLPYIPSQLKMKSIQMKDVEDLFDLQDIN